MDCFMHTPEHGSRWLLLKQVFLFFSLVVSIERSRSRRRAIIRDVERRLGEVYSHATQYTTPSAYFNKRFLLVCPLIRGIGVFDKTSLKLTNRDRHHRSLCLLRV